MVVSPGHCLFSLCSLLRTWLSKIPSESLLIHWFSLLANKPGSTFSKASLKIFSVNPGDAGKSWQAGWCERNSRKPWDLGNWGSGKSTFGFLIHWVAPDPLESPLQNIFLKCTSSAVAYQETTFQKMKLKMSMSDKKEWLCSKRTNFLKTKWY